MTRDGTDPPGRELISVLLAAGKEGLRPRDYHLEEIEELTGRLAGGRFLEATLLLADLDLLLSDAFLVYASHTLAGRVNPESFDPEWIAARREADLVAVLEEAVRTGRVRSTLEGLLPTETGYRRLRETLGAYREIQARGGWQALGEGPALRSGDSGERVARLRRRLEATGNLAPDDSGDPATFDPSLEEAARRFQRRHGLTPDGVIGARTREALEVPVSARIRTLELNMERWRWLPQELGSRYVLVNIPGFSLQVVEEDTPVLEMAVVVGTAYRRTPVFSDLMRYLVIAPHWEVPAKLAVQDKLSLVQKDPGYLTRQGFRVYDGWGADRKEIDPSSVDWTRLGPGTFPYHLRQDPGPLNALGRVKFMFPNRFNVYLHDTSSRELFDREDRGFSSGCIRIERPLDLAAYLLRDDPAWPREAIEARMAEYRETTVPLPRSVPVHILYWTAWAAPDGTVHFRKDLYGRDRRLDEALRLPPPEE